MLASFIIAFHSLRIDNLCQTIRFLERNRGDVIADSELILMCQDRIGQIKSGFACTRTVSLKSPNMQKSRAVNEGVRLAQAARIVVLDSDRILPPGYFRSVLDRLEPRTVVSAGLTHKLSHMVTDDNISAGFYDYEEQPRRNDDPYSMTIFSGNAALFVEDYWRAGGMDEEYIGYGFEDSDMTWRLRRAGVRPVLREEIEIHLYHSRHSYGAEDQKRLFLDNGLRFCRKWRQPLPPQLAKELNEYTKELL